MQCICMLTTESIAILVQPVHKASKQTRISFRHGYGKQGTLTLEDSGAVVLYNYSS